MRQKRKQVDKSKERFWRKQLAKLSSSGLSQSAFCLQERLNPNTLSWWKRRLAKIDSVRSSGGDDSGQDESISIFVPVSEARNTAKDNIPPGTVAELDLSSKVLRIFAGANRHVLYEILAALREVSI